MEDYTACSLDFSVGDILLLVPEADLEVADMVNHPEGRLSTSFVDSSKMGRKG